MQTKKLISALIVFTLVFSHQIFGINIANATDGTYYPVAGANSPCDGWVSHYPGGTYASIRTATDSLYADGATTNTLYVANSFADADVGAVGYYIQRTFLNFDTSSLPDTAVISSATLSVYPVSRTDDENTNLALVFSSAAGTNTVTTADYDQVGSTEFATALDIGALNLNAYNDFTLNATGLTNINKTGYTKLALRNSNDLAGTAPSANGVRNSVGISSADLGNAPKLVVTYTVPAVVGNPQPPQIMIFE